MERRLLSRVFYGIAALGFIFAIGGIVTSNLIVAAAGNLFAATLIMIGWVISLPKQRPAV